MSFLHVCCYITHRNCICITNLEISTGSKKHYFFFFLWCYSPNRALAASFEISRSHSVWHTTIGRIPLDTGSDRRRNLHLTTQKWQILMSSAGFETATPASERPQKLAVHSADIIPLRRTNIKLFWISVIKEAINSLQYLKGLLP